VGGYYLCAERGERIALARLANDLENLPDAEGGVGGLSPRLEAELIAMLTRPAPAHTTSADRLQTAAVFSLLGTLAGVLGLVAVLWLNQLNIRVQEQAVSARDQARALEDLEKTVTETADAQRLAFDALLGDAGGSGSPAERVGARYGKLARERDDARLKLTHQATINDALAARARELDLANSHLKESLDRANKLTDTYEKDARDAPKLRAQVSALEVEMKRQTRTIADQNQWLDAIENQEKIALVRKSDWNRYAAFAGWGACVLLALGLVASLFRAPAPSPESPIVEGDSPPHRIV
jgi:hypothetical protein